VNDIAPVHERNAEARLRDGDFLQRVERVAVDLVEQRAETKLVGDSAGDFRVEPLGVELFELPDEFLVGHSREQRFDARTAGGGVAGDRVDGGSKGNNTSGDRN